MTIIEPSTHALTKTAGYHCVELLDNVRYVSSLVAVGTLDEMNELFNAKTNAQ